jgi:Leucine-rich repeat (LRR) protein
MARTLGQINAMANITSQTTNQRTAFGETFGGQDAVNNLIKGVAGDLTGIFPSLNARIINEAAYNEMKSTIVTTTQPTSYNPDFNASNIDLNFAQAPTYDSLTATGGSITLAKDKPSLIGPNLKSIGFDADGAPSITPGITNLNRNSQTADNRNAIGTQGFGRFYKDVNNLGPRFANYLLHKFNGPSNDDPDLGQSRPGTYSEGPIPARSTP